MPHEENSAPVPAVDEQQEISLLFKYETHTIMAGVLIIAATAIITYVCYFQNIPISKESAAWGQLGDYFGGLLNPVVGIATVFLILVSIKLQRTELKQTREELKNSSTALAQQSKVMNVQQFESTFFNWLQNYRSILESITENKIENSISRIVNGSEALKQLIVNSKIRSSYELTGFHLLFRNHPSIIDSLQNGKSLREEDVPIYAGTMTGHWEILYQTNEDRIDGLFRILYRLIKWIDENELLSQKEKWTYIAILRAQLSQSELKINFYNGLTFRGNKFRPLIEKYALFDNLPDKDMHVKFLKLHGLAEKIKYTDSAFNSNLAKKNLGI